MIGRRSRESPLQPSPRTGLSMRICPRSFADAVERSVMNHVLKSVLALAASAGICSVAFGASAPVSVFEDFRFNPLTNGWKVFGQTNLFAWNATNQNLEVIWDSSKSNSYFYKPDRQ